MEQAISNVVNKIKSNNSSKASWVNNQKFYLIMLLPGILYFLIFCYLPMAGLIIGFTEYNISKGLLYSKWIGLDNFKTMFTYPEFWNVLRNTLLIGVYKIICGSPMAVIVALMINEVKNKYLSRILQNILYLPHFLSWVILGGVLISILSPSTGIVNSLIKSMGFNPIYFLADKDFFRGTVVVSHIWKELGWGTIIYLAALSGIDQSLYEAAKVDGAGKLKQIRYISIPLLLPIFMLVLILNLGNILGIAGFEQIFVLINTAVLEVGDIIDYYVYREGLLNSRIGFATAVGLFKSVVSFILVIGSNTLLKRLTQKSLW